MLTKCLLCLFQESPTNDAAGDFEKGFVDDGQPLETDTQSPKVVQPAQGALDNPAGLAKAAAMRLTPAGDLRGDARRVQWLAVLVMVVAAIGLHESWFRQRSAALASDRWDRFDQREKLGDIVAVGAGEDHRERDALASVMRWCLEPGRARSVAFGPVFDRPPRRVWTRSRRWYETNRCGRPHAAVQAALGAGDPTRRPPAMLAAVASNSSHSPSPWGASPKGCQTAARTGCR